MNKIDIVNNVIWDRLPIYKIVKYLFKQGSFKPFAQARICYILNRGFKVRLWSFEVNPPCEVFQNGSLDILNDSVLSIICNFDPKQADNIIIITCNRNGKYLIRKDDKIEDHELNISCFAGEDLQGIYWGIEFLIAENFLKSILNNFELNFKKGSNIKLNFLKSCNKKDYYHCGGFVDIDKYDLTKNLENLILN